MTRYGPDISSYQQGLDLSRLQHASFVIAKTTEGTYYTDDDYQGWRQQASALRKPFFWYHFLSGEDSAAQARHTLANVGDVMLPGMLDAEPAGTFSPTLAQMIGYVDAAHDVVLNLRLIYLPRWHWLKIGSPSLAPLAARGLSLVSSSYPGGSGAPAEIYPGDTAAGWEGYGGMTPLLYQFTNQATDGGQLLDYNAYRGTDEQFSTLMYQPSQGDDMPACMNGDVKTGENAVTMVCVPPANFGSAGWGNVWFSLGSDFGTAHVRVAAYVHGEGWRVINDVAVPAAGDRVNPFGGPLPQATQKISIVRGAGPDVPLGWLVEAAAR